MATSKRYNRLTVLLGFILTPVSSLSPKGFQPALAAGFLNQVVGKLLPE